MMSRALALVTVAALANVATAGFCDNKQGYYCQTGTISKFCECDYDRKCKKGKCKYKRDCDTAFETRCALGCRMSGAGTGQCNTADKVCGQSGWPTVANGGFQGPPVCPLVASGGVPAKLTNSFGQAVGTTYKTTKNIMDSAIVVQQKGMVVTAREKWFFALMNYELMKTTIPCTAYTPCDATCKATDANAAAATQLACDNAAGNTTASNCTGSGPCTFGAAAKGSVGAGKLGTLYSTSSTGYAAFACSVSYPQCAGVSTIKHDECIRKCEVVTTQIAAYEKGCLDAHADAMTATNGDLSKIGFVCKSLITITDAAEMPSANRCDGVAGGEAGKWCVKGTGVGFTAGGWTRDCTYICTKQQNPKFVTNGASGTQVASFLVAFCMAVSMMF